MEGEKAAPVKLGVGIMLRRGEMICLCRRLSPRGQGSFGWCGGHVEPGESLAEAAVRELFEETGLSCRPGALRLFAVSEFSIGAQPYLDFAFSLELGSGEPARTEPEKLEPWNWYALSRLPEPLFPAVPLALRQLASGQIYDRYGA